MVIKEDRYFEPANANRRLHIYLPDHYYESEERYPVMYFFDGHNLFFHEDATYGTSWGLKDFLDHWPKNMIIVGIECGHEGDERLIEYSPYHYKTKYWGEIFGKGIQTMDWIVWDLKHYIDQKFRTYSHREATAIGGSSMGGLMSLFAVVCYNHTFSKAACLSSAIGMCSTQLKNDIKACPIHEDTRVYLSLGQKESRKWTAAVNRAMQTELEKKGANTLLYYQYGGSHCEADWAKQVDRFMNYLWCS